MVFSYTAKLVKKVELHRKAHFLIPKDLISIIEFLTTFKFACGTNHLYQEAAMWILRHFKHETLASARNSCMYAEDSLALLATPVRNQAP